jgi:hypothetical protein
MLVFIDESGDPGFKVADGASPIFVVAMVIIQGAEEAQAITAIIDECRKQTGHRSEFKFNKTCDDFKDRFFELVAHCPFSVRAIVVEKDVIYSPRLRASKERFYEYFVRKMMENDGGVLENAKVIIDGSGERTFRQDLNAALRRKLGRGVIRDVRFKDSKSDNLVQLADMCAGAIARSYRRDRKTPDKWRRLLRPRIEDVWEFE